MHQRPDGLIEITVSELRAELSMILYRVALKEEKFLILKNGHPYAVLGPVPENVAKRKENLGHPNGGGESSRGISKK
jgi:antitoxin (DNA-binding transcriptional repressor) of toxin-antitoxin stability system